MAAAYKVGKVTHYFDRLGVAVVELDADLAVGDTIRFERGGEELFQQEVSSMQIDKKEIELAKKGQEVGLKTIQEVKEGAEIFKE